MLGPIDEGECSTEDTDGNEGNETDEMNMSGEFPLAGAAPSVISLQVRIMAAAVRTALSGIWFCTKNETCTVKFTGECNGTAVRREGRKLSLWLDTRGGLVWGRFERTGRPVSASFEEICCAYDVLRWKYLGSAAGADEMVWWRRGPHDHDTSARELTPPKLRLPGFSPSHDQESAVGCKQRHVDTCVGRLAPPMLRPPGLGHGSNEESAGSCRQHHSDACVEELTPLKMRPPGPWSACDQDCFEEDEGPAVARTPRTEWTRHRTPLRAVAPAWQPTRQASSVPFARASSLGCKSQAVQPQFNREQATVELSAVRSDAVQKALATAAKIRAGGVKQVAEPPCTWVCPREGATILPGAIQSPPGLDATTPSGVIRPPPGLEATIVFGGHQKSFEC